MGAVYKGKVEGEKFSEVLIKQTSEGVVSFPKLTGLLKVEYVSGIVFF